MSKRRKYSPKEKIKIVKEDNINIKVISTFFFLFSKNKP